MPMGYRDLPWGAFKPQVQRAVRCIAASQPTSTGEPHMFTPLWVLLAIGLRVFFWRVGAYNRRADCRTGD